MELKKAKIEEREREKELRKKARIEEKKKILEAKMALEESNRKNNENVELEKKQQEIETVTGQLKAKEDLIQQLQTELDDRDNNLESSSNELNKREEEITRLRTDLQQKMEEAEELKEKEREGREREKEEEKIKKMELKKAKIEEREREKKLRKEAKIEEKKRRLEAEKALEEENPTVPDSEITNATEDKKDIKDEKLPQWEPVRTKKPKVTEFEEEKELEEIKKEIEEKKKELEPAEKRAKMEERERERKLRKEAKIEEKKRRLEAKNSLKERIELGNKISEENPEYKDETFEQKEGTTLEEKHGEEILSIDGDSKIDLFRDIKSIDEETAVLLYNGGFTSIDAVSKASLKDLIRIGKIEKKLAKNIKREIEQKLQGPATETEEKPGEYFVLDEGFDEDEAKKIDKSIAEHKFVDRDDDFFEEDKAIKKDKEIDAFKGISNIDEKTASLLYENKITSIDILREKSVSELTRIKGIRRKFAKRIKKEIENIDKKTENTKEYDEKLAHVIIKDEPSIEEETHEGEWESYSIDEISKEKSKDEDKIGHMYRDYTLYRKEIETTSGKKRIVHFFSKGEPDEGKPSELPTGFEVRVNKKTGVPYLKKKK